MPERAESEKSWTVPIEEIKANNYDLKAVNPNAPDTTDKRTPEELLQIIEDKGKEVAEAIATLRQLTSK